MRPEHRGRRRIGAAALLLTAALSLSACQSSPGVAAYVGEDTITIDELDRAVDAGLDNSAVAQRYDGDQATYRRTVLQDLIGREVYDRAAEQYGVTTSESEITSRIQDVLDANGQTAEEFYAAQATDGRTEADVRESVRQFILGEKIAAAADLDGPTREPALRELYDQVAAAQAQYDLGLITLPDEATANSVLDQLTANPAQYDALAAQYPNINTVERQTIDGSMLTGLVADPTTLTAGAGQVIPLPSGEFGTLFIFDVVIPTFEELRPQLENQAGQQVQTAVTQEIASIRTGLGIEVNPRFGTLGEDGTLVDDDRGVVTVIGEDGADASAAPTN